MASQPFCCPLTSARSWCLQNATRTSTNTLEAPPARLTASVQLPFSDREACKELQQQPKLASQVVDAATDGSAQLVVALPLSRSTLDSFVQGVNPANQAMLTLSAITQDEVGKVTSLSFRYFQYREGTLWSHQHDATAGSNNL